MSKLIINIKELIQIRDRNISFLSAKEMDTLPSINNAYLLIENGKISDNDMYRIFNCGIGMVIFVNEDEALDISSRIKELEMNSFVIGTVKNKKEESSVIFL